MGEIQIFEKKELSIEQKLEILSDAAKYDVACTSSGVDRGGAKGTTGNTAACGICHSFAADGRCISLLKILMSNECVFDCKYCQNRRSNDVPRATFTPEEICRLTMGFYRRNYIEGLFLSSGIIKNPNHTMRLMYETVYRLRYVYQFNGYIHVKGIPGADEALIEETGYVADRMSVNLELPTGDGLRKLAPHKTRTTILTPMRQIQKGICADRFLAEGALGQKGVGRISTAEGMERGRMQVSALSPALLERMETRKMPALRLSRSSRRFVPAGQSTQMIVGATPETDYQVVSVAEALYEKYDLKRVFYSAYIPINEDKDLPALGTKPPLLREHRLYQADFLMRFYGFRSHELLSQERPNFNIWMDPKCDWAVRHLGNFPVEVNRADYMTLLRVPGIGVKSAKRILAARRSGAVLDFPDLKRMGVVLKRAVYFITCSGRMMYRIRLEENFIATNLIENDRKKNWSVENQLTFRQMSLFDDFHMANQEIV